MSSHGIIDKKSIHPLWKRRQDYPCLSRVEVLVRSQAPHLPCSLPTQDGGARNFHQWRPLSGPEAIVIWLGKRSAGCSQQPTPCTGGGRHTQAVAGTLQAARVAAAAPRSGIVPKSGRMPSRSMSVRAGVRYLPIVTTRAEPSSSWYTLCISPLPYVLQQRVLASLEDIKR